MHVAARLMFIGALSLASAGSATAQSLEQFFQSLGGRSQPRRAAVQAAWEKLPPDQMSCIDSRLRRARRSVNTLIERGIGPADNRVAGIVADCRADLDAGASNAAATPSFDCAVARQPDEATICSSPELASLDRTVVAGYQHVLSSEGARVANGIAEPLLSRRHACGPDSDCIRQVQLAAIAAFQDHGAPVQVPAAAQVTARDNPAYVVNGMQLGGNVGTGSADYQDYTCAPSQQYAGLTGCQRQSAERSRRRSVTELVSFLHAADGSAVYINQRLDPVAMDGSDAGDEISRLSETFGKANVLPMLDARGVTSGLIASWGAVSLQPVEAERRAALAAGTDDKPGILLDHVGNLQRSAQLGLPIYQIGGGAGYVWSASWNGRGRGTLRMMAIDASRLPGAVAPAAPVADPPAVRPAAANPEVAAQDPAKPANAPPPAATPAATAPTATPPAPPVAPAAATPPATVRVVGPPIELHPAATAATTTSASPASGNGLVTFLLLVVAVLLGAVIHLYRKSRLAQAGAVITAPAAAATQPALVGASDAVTSTEAEKMDLPALVPTESPDNLAASSPIMTEPKDAPIASIDVAAKPLP